MEVEKKEVEETIDLTLTRNQMNAILIGLSTGITQMAATRTVNKFAVNAPEAIDNHFNYLSSEMGNVYGELMAKANKRWPK